MGWNTLAAIQLEMANTTVPSHEIGWFHVRIFNEPERFDVRDSKSKEIPVIDCRKWIVSNVDMW